ncbi:efflux RND transporter periplasmic adaptor subunit [Acidiferrobacter sp.]|uniref:efflux RND transporter periplasmic adaptor subunit n=1 Tax=Acidiferrobacter sp. TaxID=1872107 RepID=UPI002617922A|nr:efflux RND transporter periplasmic adaptor subunit [Acidiferrobacter sp.]
MSRRKRLTLALAIALVVLLVVRLVEHPKKHRMAASPIPVRVARARYADIPITLRALGLVQAYRTVTIAPMITGPMIAVDFRQGTVVRRGALLARIDPRPYQAALAQALAKRAQDQALLAVALDTLKRYRMLIAHHYISAEIVAEQKATVAEDRAIVAQDNAQIESARTNLSYTRIIAPISGRTGILAVNAGNIVSPSTPGGIVTITTIQPIYVLFSLPQQDLSDVLHALHAHTLNVTAFAHHSGRRLVLAKGRLTVLDNIINQSTGTLTLKARFKNPSLALWPGAFVNVRLQVRTERHVVVVPSVAVRQGPEGAFVYVVRPSGPALASPRVKAHKQGLQVSDVPVSLGFSDQRLTVIRSGLAAGAQVVVVGGSRLHPGAQVRILPAQTGKSRTASHA